jgi:hypothetical protein
MLQGHPGQAEGRFTSLLSDRLKSESARELRTEVIGDGGDGLVGVPGSLASGHSTPAKGPVGPVALTAMHLK